MTNEASALLAMALKTATLNGSFSPTQMGARVGLDKGQSELAARSLSNMGVLVLGFDCAAQFSPEYKKAKSGSPAKRRKK